MANSALNSSAIVLTPPLIPAGRLTLVSGTPVMTSEQANKTNIYYTPYMGDRVPIYSGSVWANKQFTELTLALDSNAANTGYQQSGKNFDLFVVNDNGTLRLATGPAWTNDTTRANALAYLNGILTNAASITLKYDATSATLTAGANTATYVGTMRASANGQVTWELGGLAAGGDPVLLYLWNAYHRRLVCAFSGDSTDSWTYATAAWRSANNSVSLRASFVRGLNEDGMQADYNVSQYNNTTNVAASAGVGLDSTSSPNGVIGYAYSHTTFVASVLYGKYSGLPGLGFHFLQALEYAGGATITFWGDAGASNLQAGMRIQGHF